MQQETFDKLVKIKKLIPKINCGGCAIMMYALYKHLEATNQLAGDEKFIYLYGLWDTTIYKTNLKYIENNNKGKVGSCTHAVLFHNGCYYNAGGEYHREFPYLMDISVENRQFVIESILSDTWNRDFDRDEYIPIIESEFKVNLNEIRRDNYYEQ